MSGKYKIYRWDVVLFGNGNVHTPIIYIKPDKNLLEFAEKNKNELLVELNIPGTMYNKNTVNGFLAKSSDIPNFRKNFFEKTGLYVIVLKSPWYGYPDYLGDIEISGLTDERIQNSYKTQTLNNVSPVFNQTELRNFENLMRGLPTSAIVGIFLGFLVLLFIIVFVINK